ncbi:hypothetical protein AC249_AIPGENE25033 [Exaiptasia diaphana]|nr:hypothetical protein AC249_AIPGENE25033 [Exaiptasia diaphana]
MTIRGTEGGKPEDPVKNPRGKGENNTSNKLKLTYGPCLGIEPGPQRTYRMAFISRNVELLEASSCNHVPLTAGPETLLEYPPNAKSLASVKITMGEVEHGGLMEKLLKLSILYNQNLSSCNRAVDRVRHWFQPAVRDSMAWYICLVHSRAVGPTAKLMEMTVPAILANLR